MTASVVRMCGSVSSSQMLSFNAHAHATKLSGPSLVVGYVHTHAKPPFSWSKCRLDDDAAAAAEQLLSRIACAVVHVKTNVVSDVMRKQLINVGIR